MFSLKAKQIMTSFDLTVIIQELNENIRGSRLDNIYQISPLALLLVLHPRERLIIEAGRRIHLTQHEIEKPRFPSLFCRILRKFLRRGIVQNIEMHDFERIVSLEIMSKKTSYKLVCEVFGKGNIILTDNTGMILHALSYRKMRDRNIIRGHPLKLPPSRGYSPLEITREEFEDLRIQREAVILALVKFLSVGGLYAEELLLRTNIDKKKPASSLTIEEVDNIYGEVLNLISNFKKPGTPHIVVNGDGKWDDVLPLPLQIYSSFKMKYYPTFNQASDEYFTRLARKAGSEVYKEIIQSIETQKRILNQQKERLEHLELEAEENRRIGDAIYLHAFELQNIFRQIEEVKNRGIDWDKIISHLNEQKGRINENSTLIDSIDLEKKQLSIKIDDLYFKLSYKNKSVFKNASSYYETAKESEAKIKRLKKMIIETKKKIEDFNKAQFQIQHEKTSLIKIRKKSWFEKFHWARSSEDYLIIGGRDATANELLIKKYMDTRDLVFHADISGAPFVIIKTEGKNPSDQTMLEAAQMAASYSRGWREGWASLDVYWVEPNQINKQAPSGEYLSKGMFMVHGKRNYIRNVPLRISIGVIEKEGNLLVIGGPVSAIKIHSKYTVDIVPGRLKSGKIAKMIRNKLVASATKDFRKNLHKLKIEEIQRFIPAGTNEIAINVD